MAGEVFNPIELPAGATSYSAPKNVTSDFSLFDNNSGTFNNQFRGIGELPSSNTPGAPDKPAFDIFGQGGSNIAAGIQGIGSLAQAYAAYKQYSLGKQTLAQNRAAFNLNSSNQAKITNAQIEDRALRRAAQRSDLTGDFNAIQAAADAVSEQRRVSGAPI